MNDLKLDKLKKIDIAVPKNNKCDLTKLKYDSVIF